MWACFRILMVAWLQVETWRRRCDARYRLRCCRPSGNETGQERKLRQNHFLLCTAWANFRLWLLWQKLFWLFFKLKQIRYSIRNHLLNHSYILFLITCMSIVGKVKGNSYVIVHKVYGLEARIVDGIRVFQINRRL